MYHVGAHGGQPQQIYHGGAWQSGAGHPYASNMELHHAQYSALPVRGGRMREAIAGVGDYGYGGGLHHAGGVGYMHVGPMQPLVPQRIGGGMLVDKNAYEWYEEERGRNLEEPGVAQVATEAVVVVLTIPESSRSEGEAKEGEARQ
jgi:hypothetical protein